MITRAKRAALLAACGMAAAVWLRVGPLPDGLLAGAGGVSTTVVDRRGVVLYESRAANGTRGAWLDAARLPPNLVAATLAAEDRRFYRHFGVDPLAVVRAAWRNLREGAVVEGGSTLTQQAAKLLIARRDPERGRTRGVRTKVHEAIVAIRLEHALRKDQILALYLNLAPYGNQVEGAERASQAYFGSPAHFLTPAQAAFIAGLPQRPSRFNPFKHTASAVARQRRVLARMEAKAFITPEVAAEARAERLALRNTRPAFDAPHFVEMVLAQHAGRGLRRIATTLDTELQRDVRGIIESQRSTLTRHGAHNVAVVVLDNQRGEWLAWEGSGDYSDAEHGGSINGPLALRQPGSALKPFTYALAFEEGRSPATALPDVPSHFPTAEAGITYSPRNYDGRFRGPLLARRALAGSENVPAVALAADIGVPKLIRFLRTAGLTTLDKTAAHYGLGITLGNAEVQLAELTAAYSTLARGGLALAPTAVPIGERQATRITSERTAFWITDILSDAHAREYAFGRGGSLDFPFPVAAKTGTSEGYHDNWAIGYTREVTVGVWVGNFDRAPLTNSSGITGAGPIFHAVMLAAQARVAGHVAASDRPLVAPTADVERQSVCALSGMAAHAWCPARISEWLPKAATNARRDEDRVPCSWHHDTEDGVIVVWPPEYRHWAAAHSPRRSESPPRSPTNRTAAPARAGGETPRARHLAIQNPPAGAIYLIDPTLRRSHQTLALRASADPTAGRITWAIDGTVLGTADADRPLLWPLAPGEHRISAADTQGRRAETTVLVK
jgi:penicillin-binding protein 1C